MTRKAIASRARINRSRELSRATARYFISKAPLPVAAQFEQNYPRQVWAGAAVGMNSRFLAPNTPESALRLGECIPGPVFRTGQHSRVTASIGDRGIRVARSPEDAPACRKALSSVTFDAWQCEHYSRTAVAGFDPDAPAVRLDDFPGNPKPQPPSAPVCGVVLPVGAKYAMTILFAEPLASISNAEMDFVTDRARAQGYSTALGREFRGVADQVPEHLRDPVRIDSDGRKI